MSYLDTSVLASLFLPGANSTRARTAMVSIQGSPSVSTFTGSEFAAVVGRELRIGVISSGYAAGLLNSFDRWCATLAELVEIDLADHRVAAGFVRRFDLGLRAPDALHVAICQRLGLPLLTFDTRQAAAAQRLGVACDPAGMGGTEAPHPATP